MDKLVKREATGSMSSTVVEIQSNCSSGCVVKDKECVCVKNVPLAGSTVLVAASC